MKNGGGYFLNVLKTKQHAIYPRKVLNKIA